MSIQYEYHEYCCDGIITIIIKLKFNKFEVT